MRDGQTQDTAANNPKPPLLEMDNITKIYGNGIVANYEVDFSARQGEIHALAGENGAGKSTLMKVLFGMEHCDQGQIRIDGKPVTFHSPTEAIAAGIGMVHQHFMLAPSLTVAENIILGYEPTKFGFFLDRESIDCRTKEISEKYHFSLNPKDKVADLSVGVKQKIEILKALLRNAGIIILDEPTAVLTPQETKELFTQLIKLKQDGYTMIFISHKLNEIKEICDRITIMRAGRSKGTYDTKDISVQEISRLMVGRDLEAHILKEKAAPQGAVLKATDIHYADDSGKLILKNFNLKVQKGEILGVAGVEGNGQREMVDLITGLAKIQQGEVTINGVSIKNKNIHEIRKIGLAHIPEDRMVYGAAGKASIKDNLMSDRIGRKDFNKGLFLKMGKINEQAKQLIQEFKIKADSKDQEVGMLSGGNIQKVVVAREMSAKHSILVADQPSRGIDVGAARFIHERLIQMRDEGYAILLITADLNEVLELSDSLIVMYEGQITGYFNDVATLSEEELGLYMLGLKRQDPHEIKEAMQ